MSWLDEALSLVIIERGAQDRMGYTGVQTPEFNEFEKLAILTEEYLEFVRTINDHESLDRKLEEAVQTAAVTVAWIESLLKERDGSQDHPGA